jgi:fused signal recognition particle receptor
MGMSWLDRLRGGFSKTAERVADNLTGLASRAALDTSTLDDIEEALIASDLGPEASHRIREAIAAQKFERLDERGLRSILADEIEKILIPVAKPLEITGFPRPHVILVIGVNGSGKTTTIGKLGQWLKEQDYGVLLAAGDTFRAAAAEQLELWAERAGTEIVRGQAGSDPGAVVFDAIEAARARGHDVVIIDTAGRLHTQQHLMDELRKVRKVIERQAPGAPHETLLTIDATTGQNGLRQALLFREAVDVTGIVLTKLDGTAKGGIALAIAQELGVPVKLIGIGEALEDLRPFDPDDFARAIIEP